MSRIENRVKRSSSRGSVRGNLLKARAGCWPASLHEQTQPGRVVPDERRDHSRSGLPFNRVGQTCEVSLEGQTRYRRPRIRPELLQSGTRPLRQAPCQGQPRHCSRRVALCARNKGPIYCPCGGGFELLCKHRLVELRSINAFSIVMDMSARWRFSLLSKASLMALANIARMSWRTVVSR